MFLAIGKEFRGVLLPKMFAAGGLGKGQGVVCILGEHLQQRFTDLAAGSGSAVPVKALGPVGGGGNHSVNHHVAWAGIKGIDRFRRCTGGQNGHVADAADVLKEDGFMVAAVEQVFCKRHKGRTLAAGGHIGHTEIGDGGYTGALCDDGAFTNLHGTPYGIAVGCVCHRGMPDGLTVGRDKIHIVPTEPRFLNHSQGGGGKVFAQ